MAGNTRGKLKEKFEGVHRNFEWSKKHLAEALELIKEHNPKLSDGIKELVAGIEMLDELSLQVYAKI